MKRWLKFPHGYNGRFGIVKEQGLQFKITITPIYLVSRLMVAGRYVKLTYIVQGAKPKTPKLWMMALFICLDRSPRKNSIFQFNRFSLQNYTWEKCPFVNHINTLM